MLKVQDIPEGVFIEIEESSQSLSPLLEREIEKIWKIEVQNRKMFNDPMLSYLSFNGKKILARVVEYKTYLAQIKKEDLYDDLRINPLCVSGITCFNSQVLVGRRSKGVTQDGGLWELCPSGGLTPHKTVKEQFLEELEEEAGIKCESVSALKPFVLVENQRSHVVDIGVEAVLNRGGLGARSGEYTEMQWMKLSGIRKLVEREKKNFVDVSLELLKVKGLIII